MRSVLVRNTKTHEVKHLCGKALEGPHWGLSWFLSCRPFRPNPVYHSNWICAQL
jgi:hypothetical protein